MDTDRARVIAEPLHAGDREEHGTPGLQIRRVAHRAPAEARTVAWLHEVLGWTAVAEQELLANGLTSDELRALRLLHRTHDSRSDRVYLAHVYLIARAAGSSGHLALLVKIEDLEDRGRHPRVSADGALEAGARMRAGDEGQIVRSGSIGGVEPPSQRVAARPRDLTVGGHPVANAHFADEPERVAGPGALAVDGERARSRLDPPAPGVECRQRQSLVGSGEIERMGSGVSQRILAGRATPRRAICGRRPGFPRLASPKRRVPDGVALLAQPPAQFVDPSPRALAFGARGPRDLVDIDL
jgi:hypothetical protein